GWGTWDASTPNSSECTAESTRCASRSRRWAPWCSSPPASARAEPQHEPSGRRRAPGPECSGPGRVVFLCAGSERVSTGRVWSEQQVREALAGRGDARILGASDLEQVQQTRADGVLGVLIRAAQQIQKAPEGVLDVAAEHVAVSDQELCVQIAGGLRGGLAGARG